MPQNEKIRILDQLWRLVHPGEFIALQDGEFIALQDGELLTLSVSGESREESLHRVELLCAAIKTIASPAIVVQQLLVIAVHDRLVKVKAIVYLGGQQ